MPKISNDSSSFSTLLDFSKSVASNFSDHVQYTLFIVIDSARDEPLHKGSSLGDFQVATSTLETCRQHLSSLCANYIWHYEEFSLETVRLSKSQLEFSPSSMETCGLRLCEYALQGSVQYCENVEDQWFVSLIVSKLTGGLPNIFAQVTDSTDGDFLLIEAADFLPQWLDYDTSENRLFFHAGNLHLIPYGEAVDSEPSLFPPLDQAPTLSEAMKFVYLPFYRRFTDLSPGNPFREESLHSLRPIQKCITERMQRSDQSLNENHLHFSTCYLPISLGLLLSENSQLIAALVHTFYSRDSLDLQGCSSMKFSGTPRRKGLFSFECGHFFTDPSHQSLSNSSEDLPQNTPTLSFSSPPECCCGWDSEKSHYGFFRIAFTKCLYAQLSHPSFNPPQCFSTLYSEYLQSTGSLFPQLKLDTIKNAFDIGIRLTCAWEMLLDSIFEISDCEKNQIFSSPSPSAPRPLIVEFPSQVAFSVKSNLSDSPLMKYRLKAMLKQIFVMKKISLKGCFPHQLLYSNMNAFDYDSCEKWLYFEQETFESEMKTRSNTNESNPSSEKPAEFDESQLSDFFSKLKDFVKSDSDYTGIEIPPTPSNLDKDPVKFVWDPSWEIPECISAFAESDETGSSCDEDLQQNSAAESFPSDEEEEEEEEESVGHFMKMMDRELSSHGQKMDPIVLRDKSHLLENLLQSFSLQNGETGPMTTLLNSLGVSLPDNLDI